MRANCKKPIVRRILHSLIPLGRMFQLCDAFAEVIILKNVDVTHVVGDSDVRVQLGICNAPGLLMSLIVAERRSSRPVLARSVVPFASINLSGPYLSISHNFSVNQVYFKELVVITTSQESAFLWQYRKAPDFTIVVGVRVDCLLFALHHDGGDPAIVMSAEYLSV